MLKALIVSAALMMGTTAMAIELPTVVAADSATKTLSIEKMTCGGCAAKVKKSLAKVDGMKVVKANPKDRTVEIEVTDAGKFDISKAIAAIKEGTGWDATVK